MKQTSAPHRVSLFRDLLKSLLLPGVVAAALGLLLVHNLVEAEYDEMQDIGIHAKAQLLLEIYQANPGSPALDNLMAFEARMMNPEERSSYWFRDAAGRITAHSRPIDPALLPDSLQDDIITTQDHRILTLTRGNDTVTIATPMGERNGAIRDVVLGSLLGFIILGLLFAVVATLAARRSAGVIARLGTNISQKDEHNLTPIDRANSFAEFEPAVDRLDTLMARLDAALTAERAFATNAAHELRTPVAICLANLQRLKTRLSDPATTASATEIERGLKRLIRLIERLLQMSRAQSGLELGTVRADITPVVSLMLRELRERVTDDAKLVIQPPIAPLWSRVDPDAMGIILGNLFDNALKYSAGPMPVTVDASQQGRVIISNDCDTLCDADLEQIKTRFIRKTPVSEGFGLGLSIVQDLCRQSGCTIDISSPCAGSLRGFTATLTIPEAPAA
ncbi:MAG: HAMP domain-containing sensor histidine kinase [Sulfitobacter sp.]|nr:HAMP domain-containing sensor histidine kinase [Sulfitobacter sp.]